MALGSEVVQHGLHGVSQMPYGSFSGKSEQPTTRRVVVMTATFDIGVTMTAEADQAG